MRQLEVVIEVAVPKQHELQRSRKEGGPKRIWGVLVAVLVIAYARPLQQDSTEVADRRTLGSEAKQESPVAVVVIEPDPEVTVPSSDAVASTADTPNTVRVPVQSRPSAQKGEVRKNSPGQPLVSPPPVNVAVNSVVPLPGNPPFVSPPSVNPPKVNPQQAADPSRSPQTTARIVTSEFLAGKLILKVLPAYPALARRNRISGTVIFRAIISEQGKIKELRVESGPALLIDTATEAVRQWEYQPWILDGKPIEMESTINVIFKLRP